MSELVLRFEHTVGRATLAVWADLPRDIQERVFENAVGSDVTLRHHLAVYLHDHHPRTVHPPKPTALAQRMPRKLKTYVTSQGFFDLAIAAPSMKAALEAWARTRIYFVRVSHRKQLIPKSSRRRSRVRASSFSTRSERVRLFACRRICQPATD